MNAPLPAASAAPERAPVYLYPGELFASGEPHAVSTILGTCVALCLFDPVAGVGGLTHYLLPYHADAAQGPRFGNVAVAGLLTQVLQRGALRHRLQAKVFGGMCSKASFPHDLGTRNAEVALEFARAEGIPVVAMDCGGERGRKLVFQTDDGLAWVKHL